MLKIENFKIKRNKKNEILIQLNRINTNSELSNLFAVYFKVVKNNIVLKYEGIEDNNLKELMIADVSEDTIGLLKKRESINIVESLKSSDIAYVAFSIGEKDD